MNMKIYYFVFRVVECGARLPDACHDVPKDETRGLIVASKFRGAAFRKAFKQCDPYKLRSLTLDCACEHRSAAAGVAGSINMTAVKAVLAAEVSHEEIALAKAGWPIAAIKSYRARNGCTLVEANDAIIKARK